MKQELIYNDENTNRVKTIAEDILKMAKTAGASDVEVGISDEAGFSVVVRMGDIEKLIFNKDKACEITVYFGKKKGSASTTDMRKSALQETVNAACNIAKFTDEDPCSGLPEKSLLATDFPDVDCYHPWSITPDQAIEQATACEKQAMASDPRLVNSEGAWIDTHQGIYLLANSVGFMHVDPSTHHTLGCSLIAKDDKGMERDFDYTTAIDAADLASPDIVAKNVADRTLKRLGARRLKTQKSPVIFLASEASGLLSAFVSAISGGNLYRKSSFLLDMLGKQVFPEHIHIHEQPLLKKAFGSGAYDQDGVATRTKDFVRQGVLNSYVLSTYSARQLKLETTANAGGIHNLQIDHHDISLDALLKEMDKGLLVTELMGQGINLVTGDYSRGAAGFWVEQGEIQYPVHEITIAGNLRDMFMAFNKISNDIDYRRSIRTGSILINEMMIAGL